MLGGGTFTAQNKKLPGTYINFSSVSKASAALSERGYAAMPLMLDWGPEDEVFTVTNGDFQKDSLRIFGYVYADPEMLPLRELFQYAQTLYAYRLGVFRAPALRRWSRNWESCFQTRAFCAWTWIRLWQDFRMKSILPTFQPENMI